MKKNLTLTLLAIICSLSSFALSPIDGGPSFNACTGSTQQLTDSTTGGIWSSSVTSVATVDPNTGMVYAFSGGTTTIYYTVSSVSVNVTVTVAAPPSAIIGAGTICVGATLQLSDATPSGAWTGGSNASVSSTGLVTGLHGGTQTISYTVTAGCSATAVVTITAASVGPDTLITGATTVCIGGTLMLSNSTGGGVWSSTVSSVATVTPGAGSVTGVTAGSTTISYTVNSTCGPASIWETVTVSGSTTPPTSISGASSVHTGGGTITLTDGVSGGIWSCTSTSFATVDPSSGVVTGVTAGTAPIVYTVTGCGGTASVSTNVAVTAIDGISGHVSFLLSTPYTGPVKVWLITSTGSGTLTSLSLTATVAATSNGTGTSYYYEFLTVPTDVYYVKASEDTVTSVGGYIPTYSPNVYSWSSATSVSHTSGTADVNKNIDMQISTAAPGPGFISGLISSGANKGTSVGSPVENIPICLLNSTSSAIVQFTHTDVNGNYTFSNLAYGTYSVFPDSINYVTTPYTGITLNATTPSNSAAGFTQHTISMTITPDVTAVNNLTIASTVTAFPNPSNGRIYVQWKEKTTETGTITISDITGREVYNTTVSMTSGDGIMPIDVSGFNTGLYIISIKSSSLNYNSKLEILH